MMPLVPVLSALLLGCAALLLWGGAPWWLMGLVALPALMWAPGYGFACRLEGRGPHTGLQRALDSTWIGLALTWIDVSVVRELGLRDASAAWGLIGGAAAWMLLGWLIGRGRMHPRRTPRREILGVGAVFIAIFALIAWRGADLSRPLDGHWYLKGADIEGHQPLPLRPGMGWDEVEQIGWPESGALRLTANRDQPRQTLIAQDRLRGRLIVAVRGPIGSTVSVQGREHTVAQEMMEEPDEGLVPRYLDRGVAAVAVHLELEPGAELEITYSGDELYLFPSTEAVWSMHAVGALRYVHYYQLLNQVENQVWAEETLQSRRFTWNQPPGWSPLLAVTVLMVQPDLPGAAALFLWVLLLVGSTSVRALSLLAPGAPMSAQLLPAAMVLSHGMLMIEPGSINFPDSLYAASIVTVVTALASGRQGWLAAAGMLAGMLRWPGIITATLLAILWGLFAGRRPSRGLGALWLLVGLAGGAALVATRTGDAEDLGFILWFETFFEHWHGNYHPADLLSRVPDFYLTWLRYTGGGLLLALAGLWGTLTAERRALRFLLAGALSYSLFLCTIDHHPSHYFLPLVALTGPAVGIAAATLRRPQARNGLVILCLLGVLAQLFMGHV
ncbi:MAG: hypothetical protein ACI8S6_001719 [Myxococcota bacterium]|jgi:hypothetical protein